MYLLMLVALVLTYLIHMLRLSHSLSFGSRAQSESSFFFFQLS
jgi:hypothetical protein